MQNARLTPAVLFVFFFFFFFDFASQNILRQFWKSTKARLITYKIRWSTKSIQVKQVVYGGRSKSCNFAAITKQTLCQLRTQRKFDLNRSVCWRAIEHELCPQSFNWCTIFGETSEKLNRYVSQTKSFCKQVESECTLRQSEIENLSNHFKDCHKTVSSKIPRKLTKGRKEENSKTIYSRTSRKRPLIMSRICGRLREVVTYQRSDHRGLNFS